MLVLVLGARQSRRTRARTRARAPPLPCPTPARAHLPLLPSPGRHDQESPLASRLQGRGPRPLRWPRPLPGHRRRPRPAPARRRRPPLRSGQALPAARQHLDRRDHSRLHLLLLRRDAGGVPLSRPEVRRGVPGHPRLRQEGRLRGERLREAARQGLLARAVALRRDDGRHPTRDRREHRADLPRELPEPRRLHEHRLRAHRAGAPRRGDPPHRVHEGGGRHHARDHRVRRALQLQRRAAAGEGGRPLGVHARSGR